MKIIQCLLFASLLLAPVICAGFEPPAIDASCEAHKTEIPDLWIEAARLVDGTVRYMNAAEANQAGRSLYEHWWGPWDWSAPGTEIGNTGFRINEWEPGQLRRDVRDRLDGWRRAMGWKYRVRCRDRKKEGETDNACILDIARMAATLAFVDPTVTTEPFTVNLCNEFFWLAPTAPETVHFRKEGYVAHEIGHLKMNESRHEQGAGLQDPSERALAKQSGIEAWAKDPAAATAVIQKDNAWAFQFFAEDDPGAVAPYACDCRVGGPGGAPAAGALFLAAAVGILCRRRLMRTRAMRVLLGLLLAGAGGMLAACVMRATAAPHRPPAPPRRWTAGNVPLACKLLVPAEVDAGGPAPVQFELTNIGAGPVRFHPSTLPSGMIVNAGEFRIVCDEKPLAFRGRNLCMGPIPGFRGYVLEGRGSLSGADRPESRTVEKPVSNEPPASGIEAERRPFEMRFNPINLAEYYILPRGATCTIEWRGGGVDLSDEPSLVARPVDQWQFAPLTCPPATFRVR